MKHQYPPRPPAYGTKKWLENQYARTKGDPWGIYWRPSQRHRLHVTLREVTPHLSKAKTLVDFGCSTGDFTNLLSQSCGGETKVIGIDLASEAINRAKQRFPHIEFSTGSILESLSEYRASIDVIACLEILYYLSEKQQYEALVNINDALSLKGVVIFSSLTGTAPYFSPNTFRELISKHFNIITQCEVNVRLLSLLEKLAMLSSKIFQKMGLGAAARWPQNLFSAIPNDLVTQILSHTFGPPSHIIIVARKKSI